MIHNASHLNPFSKARWISFWALGSRDTTPPATYYRHTFTLRTERIKAACLKITALGLYECELNGRPVSDAIFTPGWTDYTERVAYQNYEITALLKEGENAIGCIVGDGWYSGHIGWNGRQNYGDHPLMIAEIDVEYEGGAREVIASSDQWRARIGPILENDLLMGETYDARLEVGAWSSPRYDARDWHPVLLPEPPAISIESPISPQAKRMIRLGATRLHDLVERIHPARIYDLGQNICGRCAIEVEAPAGTTIKMRHGEMLNERGELYTENLRGARATDIYVCKGKGKERWEPRFTFHGFRYVEITGLSDDTPFSLEGVALYSELEATGEFECSSDLLNQLQSNIVWSQRGNFLETPTDCPQRDERLGWSGDAQIFMRTSAFNMDVRQFFRKWLRDLRDAQSPNGAIAPFAPKLGRMELIPFEDGGPAYSDAIVICPWTHYLCYGGIDILSENYEAMRKYMDFLSNHRCKDFIRGDSSVDPWGGYGDWLAQDGSNGTEGGTAKDLIGTAFYAHLAAIMQKVAALLGDSEATNTYGCLRSTVINAFQDRFVCEETILRHPTQTGLTLALHFDLLPSALRARAAHALATDINIRGHHMSTGFVGTSYLLDTLADNGYMEVAFALLEQTRYPSWLFPVTNGATTIWERWDGWTAEKGMQTPLMNSFNHYAYGAVGAWLYKRVAGIDLCEEKPGYQHINFRPTPGGSLTRAKANLKTAHGDIRIAWELDSLGALKIQCVVPSGCTATLHPPLGYAGSASALSSGLHSFHLQPQESPILPQHNLL